MTDGRKKGLDGLRALAVLLVFATHKTDIGNRLGLGGFGVHLFFVLSGFLIIDILRRDRLRVEVRQSSLGNEWWGFFLRRTLRIFPVYYVTLGVLAVIDIAGLVHIAPSQLGLYATYLTNIPIAYQTFAYPVVGGHLWSLAVEEQFYLFSAPIFLAVPAKRSLALCWIILGIAVASSAALWAARFPGRTFYTGSLSNFGLMAIGGIAALWSAARRLPGWLAPLLLAGYFVAPVLGYLGHASGLAFWTSPLLIALLLPLIVRDQESALVRALDWKPLRWLGRVSYGFYLFHGFIEIGHVLPQLPKLAATAFDFAASVGLSALSWLTLETWALRLGRHLASSRAPGDKPPARMRKNAEESR